MAAALLIDTCGPEGYVAVIPVGVAEPALPRERCLGIRATQEELLPAMEAVLAEAGVALPELDALAVVNGPGSFTGVRIGLAAAKGLCEAADLRMVTLSRLEVLASAAGVAPVWAWLQAGRGDVYAARFGGGGGDALGESVLEMRDETREGRVLKLDEAIRAAGRDAVAVCEEGLRTAASDVVFVEATGLRESLRKAAESAILDQRWADVALADALYLRVPDAELLLRARQG